MSRKTLERQLSSFAPAPIDARPDRSGVPPWPGSVLQAACEGFATKRKTASMPHAGTPEVIKGRRRFRARLPLILKPLEWINVPLDLCPENIRELVGKIAIVTMVNAAAVLTYVWMFRRHH